jgi:hypothetical protein
MTNRFFNNAIDILPLSKARSAQVEANFSAVGAGFDVAQIEVDLLAPLANPVFTGTALMELLEVSDVATFGAVVINGTLDMNAGTTATITGLAAPTGSTDAAHKGYVDTQIANLIASAPGVLDTLDELASALGDDANFATNTAASIATKLPKAGGTMTGVLNMGGQRIVALPAPSAGTDAVHLDYVTTLYGSTASAAASASAAAADRDQTGLDRTASGISAAAADASRIFASKINLGAKSSPPTVDNQGAALLSGANYYDTSLVQLRVWTGTAWAQGLASVAGVESLNGQQGALVTKTVNGSSILGSGNLAVGDVTLAGTQTLTNKTITETVFALTGTTPAFTATNGAVQTWTLTAASSPTNALTSGQSIILVVTPGSFAITWPGATWTKIGGSGALPALFSAGKTTVVLWMVGSNLYGSHLGDTA